MEKEDEYLLAVKRNDLEAVEQLMNGTVEPAGDDPIDINDVDSEGRTALVVAIENGYTGTYVVNWIN